MIFVTVGSMLPFDRFVAAMDDWAAANPKEAVFAQIGGGTYEPRHMEYARMLTPGGFAAKVEEATLIVAHAGMGSVIMAAEAGKPIVLFPRRHALGEHTTDHQLDTVGWLKDRPGIHLAMEAEDLATRIATARHRTDPGQNLSKTAPAAFVARLREALVG